MKIHKSYKFRLSPTKEQIAMLKQHGGNRRFVWNKLIEYARKYQEQYGKYPSKKQLREQEKVLRTQFDFITMSHSQPIQDAVDKLSNVYVVALSRKNVSERNKQIAIAKTEKDEEKRKKKLEKAYDYGFPKFKKKSKFNDSIHYPQYFKIKKSMISFPKLGWINYTRHRVIKGKPLFVTITQDGNQYYVSITCELKIKDKPMVDLDKANIVGADLGLPVFATISDNTEIKNPKTLKKFLKKLRKQNKKLSRQKMEITGETSYGKPIKVSSNNRKKQIVKLQSTYRKIRNIRKDFLHQTSYYMIAKYDGIVLENLDIKELLQKGSRVMSRSISDASWYEFRRQVSYKSVWNHKRYVEVDRYFPSTQKCSQCGGIMHMSLRDRMYICPICSTVMGRDRNSSLNLRDEGIKILKSLIKLNTVATTGIQVCGPTAIAVGMKQEQVVDDFATA
jgi:putative transposase